MCEKIAVRVIDVPLPDGREAIVESKKEPIQRWKKWYPYESAAGTELSALGLTVDKPPVGHGKILHIRRRLKEDAIADPEELIRYGFGCCITDKVAADPLAGPGQSRRNSAI